MKTILLRDAVSLLRAHREAQGLSLAELAERTGISKSSLSRLENERSNNPTVETLTKIADAMGIELTLGVKPVKAA